MSRIHSQDLEGQPDLFDEAETRSLLDQLLADSRLYRRSKDYEDLLQFVVRLRNFAPFNAMLLQVQKPGLRYAASARDWRQRFGRWPKEGTRPLLIMWPFGPVALVYDVADTEGSEIPVDALSFPATGPISHARLYSFETLLLRKNIVVRHLDAGDGQAGYIRILERESTEKDVTRYGIWINRNHEPVVQFTTLAHELGHLYLGHLGRDKKLNVPRRPRLTHAQREIEAESVAYVVCCRNNVEPKSQTYLSSFVSSDATADTVDVYQVMRAAGQVETVLGLAARSKFDTRRPKWDRADQ